MRCPRGVVAAAAVLVPCAASAAVWCFLAALVPSGCGVAALVVVAALSCLAGRPAAEPVAVRVLHGARALSASELTVLAPVLALAWRDGGGPLLLTLQASPRWPGVLPVSAGWTVLMPGGLLVAVRGGRVAPREAAAGIVHAAAVARVGMTLNRPAWQLWCLPWTLLLGVAAGLGRVLLSVPGAGLAWRARAAVAVVAAVQEAQAGHPWVSVLLVGIGAASYLTPRAERAARRRLQEVGDAAVREAGMGADYVRLAQVAGCPVGLERRARLSLG